MYNLNEFSWSNIKIFKRKKNFFGKNDKNKEKYFACFAGKMEAKIKLFYTKMIRKNSSISCKNFIKFKEIRRMDLETSGGYTHIYVIVLICVSCHRKVFSCVIIVFSPKIFIFFNDIHWLDECFCFV